MFVIAKSWGSEIRYEVVNKDKKTVCSGGPFSSNSDNVITDCQMTAGDYSVKCIDTYGDGWHGGYIAIEGVEDQKLCQTFTSGHLKVEEFKYGPKTSFNYDSTGGHQGSAYIPAGSDALKDNRGTSHHMPEGSPSNKMNDGSAVIEK